MVLPSTRGNVSPDVENVVGFSSAGSGTAL